MFTRKSSLKAHLTTHEYIRYKLDCSFCGKKYSKLYNLKVHHQKSHSDLSMPKKLNSTPVQRNLFSANLLPQCDICGRIFQRKSNVKDHILNVHVGSLKLSCELCKTEEKEEKLFSRPPDLRRHIKKFHGITNVDQIHHGTNNSGTVIQVKKRQLLTPVDLNDVVIAADDKSTYDGYDNSQEIRQFTTSTSATAAVAIFHSNKNEIYQETISKKEQAIHHLSKSASRNSNKNETRSFLPTPMFELPRIDFCLPPDFHHVRDSDKFDYKRIRTNIYADHVKPIQSLDFPECDCEPQYGCGDACINRLMYSECNPKTCPCGAKCQNTKIQKRVVAPVQCFITQNKGWGVKTNHLIKKDTYILEYVGEVVEKNVFEERMSTIYENDTNSYCLQLEGSVVIDAHRMGNECRFVNHSCEPNCHMQKWLVNGRPRMALFSMRDIQPGEELTFDYKFFLFNPDEDQVCSAKQKTVAAKLVKNQSISLSPLKTRYLKLC